MLNKEFKRSISFRFLGLISIILFLSAVVISTIIAINERNMLMHSLTTKGQSLASNIATRNENAMIIKGSAHLDTVLSELITDEEILYTIIEDAEGKFLTTQFESINFKWPGLEKILIGISKDSELKDIISAIKKRAAVREVSVPIKIGNDTLGKVTIGMSEQKIHEQILKSILFVFMLNLIVAFALGAALFVASKKAVLDPLIELSHAATRFAKGDLSTRLAIKTIGEVQLLVDSFNHMAKDLQNTTVSKDYMNDIVHSLADTLIVLNPDMTIKTVNRAVVGLLGFSEDELKGKPFEVVIAGDISKKLDTLVNKGSMKNTELAYRTKQGASVPVLVAWSLVNNKNQEVTEHVLIGKDITDRKKAEEALREANDRLNATLQASPAAIMTLNSDGIITIWNEAAERIFDWSKDEIVGEFFDLIVPKDNREEFHVLHERVIHGQSFLDMEVRLMRKGGSLIDVSLSTSSLHDAKGESNSFMAVMTDITERKKMEEEILKVDRLESLGILAGGIAHDFNNILTAILGNINLMKMSVDPNDKIYNRLAQAEKASLRATDLTQQLLTFSKGGMPVKKTASIVEIIRESAGFALRGSNVKCQCEIPDTLWQVEVDEGQISQAINNLVINSDQAMPDGGTILICAENVMIGEEAGVPLREGKYVKISVKDQGPGISEEQIRKIFDPFFTTKQKGNGLGLAIVYSVIKKHGGYITVESTLGVGTAFTFYIPASEKRVTEKETVVEYPFSGNGRILIMDDDEIVRDVAGEMLKQSGYEVGYAEDGLEAIEMYIKAKESSSPFDVVVMDLTIPGGMGGEEAVKKLREIDSQVKAVVSSGYSNDDVMARFREYGFSGVITKPYRSEEISSILHELLSHKKLA